MGKTKKGAASFYIVAFSTLILLIIAASFTALVIAQITRTSNDDLAQSAYDSAMAGVEDAKLAFYNYRNCLANGAEAEEPSAESESLNCGNVVWLVEEYKGCDATSYILGRKKYGEEPGEILIQESETTGNNMQQAYTCVKLMTETKDYAGSLSSSNPMKVIRLKFGNGVNPADIKSIVVKWGKVENNKPNYYNFGSGEDFKVEFPSYEVGGGSLSTPADPPVIAVALLQTGNDGFNMDSFSIVEEGRTNRGMAFLVPTDEAEAASTDGDNYKGIYNGEMNVVPASTIVKSNDRNRQNLPNLAYCTDDGGNNSEDDNFMCVVKIELPDARGGGLRDDDAFLVAISLPYGRPETDYSLEFYCAENKQCAAPEDIVVEDEDYNMVGSEEVLSNGKPDGLESYGDSTCWEMIVDGEEPRRMTMGGIKAESIVQDTTFRYVGPTC